MTTDALYSAVRALPKIELHRHLEGAVRLQTLVDIAHDAGIEMPEYDAETLRPFVQMMPGETHDHLHFLSKFHTLRQFFRSPEIIQRVAREVVADAAADNVKYMELRFTPRALSNILNCSYEEIISWVCQAASAEAAAHNIQVRYIVSMNRHESVEIGEQVLNAALALRALGIVAIDLAGNENGFPAEPFRDVFERAKTAGMGVTIHAGEWAGVESMYTAIHNLGADRIGHGVRALEDPGLVDLLTERQIVLEICPTSNVHSGVVSDWTEHPIQALYKNRVRTTINTDDPLVSNITLSDEIVRALEHMAFNLDDIKTQTLTAARAAFLPPDERDTLAAQFETWFAAAVEKQN
ncbi:MAG: adenosine deaminase [Anaerolineae bacterium]|nr:adenosine deaminase [Anaerolineae bacterium]